MAGLKESIVNYWRFEDLTDSAGTNNGTLHVNATAYYPFNGNANDESDNSNDGTVNGATLTTDRFGNADKAYSFDDVDNLFKLYVPNSDDKWESGDLTFSMWFKPTNLIESQFIWDHYNWRFYISSTNRLAFAVGRMNDPATGPAYTIGSDNPLSNNNWYHATAIYHPDSVGGNGYIKLYLNGELQETRNIGSDTIATDYGDDDLQWGNSRHGAAVPFEGSIDESMILDKALNDNEVASLYNLTNRHDLNDIYVDGKINNAVDLYNAISYVDTGSAISLDHESSSISFWLYIDDYLKDNGTCIMSYDKPTSGTQHFFVCYQGHSDNLFFMEPTTNNKEVYWNGKSTLTNGWHHFAFTMGTGGEPTLYLDGVDQGAPDSAQKTVVDDFNVRHIAAIYGYNEGYGDRVSTRLDELGIFNKELSSDEANRVYNSGVGSTYPIDFEVSVGIDGKGVVTKDPDEDYYAYGDEVTLTPTPQLGSQFNEWSGDINQTINGTNTGGVFNTDSVRGDYSLEFDGTGTHRADVDGVLNDVYEKQQYSWGCWVKRTGTWTSQSRRLLMSKTNILEFTCAPSNYYVYPTTKDSGGYRSPSPVKQLTLNEWHHIFATCDGTTTKFYFDGVYVNSVANAGFLNPSDNIYIGNWSSNQEFIGLLDEVLVYNRAITADEVLKIYNGTIPITSLNGYYSFEEGSGSIINDTKHKLMNGSLYIDDEYTLTSEFSEYPTVRSESIYLDTVPATKARLTATTTSDNSNFIFGICNVVTSGVEGVGCMEETTNGTTHTFTDATGNEVQYQIWGKVPGTKISNVVVKINP